MISRRSVLHALASLGAVPALSLSPMRLLAGAKLTPDARSALIVVDVQNCFLAGGTLPVKDGDAVIPIINRIAAGFENVIITQDWHTPGHSSFASSHRGKKPLDTLEVPYGTQVLWPDHCVQGTPDAQISKRLDIAHAQIILRKGYHRDVDSYSAFEEADHKTATGLGGYLKERGIQRVFVTGLATDFCVAWTAMDACKTGFETYVVEDACRAIDLNGSLAAAWKSMAARGVQRIRSEDLSLRTL